MKLSIDLAVDSPQEWVDAVMNDFNSFLQDHADCERKASAMAMSMVAKFPDRLEIIPELIETAVEELEHFEQVYQIMASRGVALRKGMIEDLYVKDLLKLMKSDREGRFLDRLLLGSIVECRGAERFKLIYEALEPGELKQFYHDIWTSEAKHGNIYVGMAMHYFDEDRIYKRLNWFMEEEGKVIQKLPIQAALH